jgi:hypothetical protein
MATSASHLQAIFSPDQGAQEQPTDDGGSVVILPLGGHRDLFHTFLEEWTRPTTTLWYRRDELAFVVAAGNHFLLFRYGDPGTFDDALGYYVSL